MKTIKLLRGKELIVDDIDYPEVSKYIWTCAPTGHACRHNKYRETIYLEQELFKNYHDPKTRLVFKNRNPLDLRRENVIFVPWGVASVVARKTKSLTSSKYKGVFLDKRDGWVAYLRARNSKGKRYNILYKKCKSEREAILLRNKVAVEHYGELAYQPLLD